MFAQPTQILVTAYPAVAKQAALVAPNTKQLALNLIRAFNRSGSAIDVGLLKKFSSASFSLYAFDGTSTYTRFTSPPLAGANAGRIYQTGVNNSGFVIQTKYKSGLIGFTVSQVGAGGTYAYQYWNGSAWSTLTTIAVPVYSALGDIVIVFLPPVDWVVGGPSGLDSTRYSIRVIGTTAPGADVLVNDLWGGALLEFYSSVADKTGVSLEFQDNHPLILEGGEGVMPYFGTANAANGMTISYTTF